MYRLVALVSLLSIAQAQIQCTQANTAFCSDDSDGVTGSNIILRCQYATGSAAPGNCNDQLANVPPRGVKNGAYCWQTSPTTGDAQCTFNCVMVTAANGTTFYPLGCDMSSLSSSSTSISTASGQLASSQSSVMGTMGAGGTSSSSGLRSFSQTANTATSASTSQTSSQSTTSTSSTNAAHGMLPNGEASFLMSMLGFLLALF